MKNLKLDIQKFASGSMQFSNGTMLVQVNWSSSIVGDNPTDRAKNNKSRVSADIYVMRTDSYTTTGNFTGHININGGIFGYNTYGSARNGQWLHLHSASTEVGHNSDGTKTIYLGGACTGPTETSWEGKTASGGQNVGLDTISRMSSITSFVGLPDAQERTNNVEGQFKVEYTRYSSAFSDNLVIQYLDRVNTGDWATLRTIQNYTSGDIFSFTNEELQTLFASAPEQNMVGLQVYLNTYSGQDLIGPSSSVSKMTFIHDNLPIFSDFEFKDVNSTTVALTGDNTVAVKGYSSIEVKIPVADKATPQKGATMSNYTITGVDEPIPYSDSQAVSTTITNCDIGTFEVNAYDSRTNHTSVTKSATDFIEYEPIYLNISTSSVVRTNNNSGDEATLTIRGTIWNDDFGSVTNSITSAIYRLKTTDSQTYVTGTTDITPTINQDGTFVFTGLIRSDNVDYTWNLQDSYDIQIEIADELSDYTINLILNSAIPTISLSKNGVGIMCAYDDSKGGALQIAGEPYAMGDTLPINTVVEYSGNTVPTGYELVEDYSTDEIKTNQVWIDGKSIYRKVLHITSGIAVDTDKYINISSLNIDNIVDLKGWTHQGGTGFGYISLYFNDGTGHGNKLHTQQGSTIIVYNHHWAASEIYIIIEYTKN